MQEKHYCRAFFLVATIVPSNWGSVSLLLFKGTPFLQYLIDLKTKSLFIYFFFCHIHPLFTRKQTVLLYFVREVRIVWELPFPWCLGHTCLPRKGWFVQLSAFSKHTTDKLASLFSTTAPKRRAPSCEYHF